MNKRSNFLVWGIVVLFHVLRCVCLFGGGEVPNEEIAFIISIQLHDAFYNLNIYN